MSARDPHILEAEREVEVWSERFDRARTRELRAQDYMAKCRERIAYWESVARGEAPGVRVTVMRAGQGA